MGTTDTALVASGDKRVLEPGGLLPIGEPGCDPLPPNEVFGDPRTPLFLSVGVAGEGGAIKGEGGAIKGLTPLSKELTDKSWDVLGSCSLGLCGLGFNALVLWAGDSCIVPLCVEPFKEICVLLMSS